MTTLTKPLSRRTRGEYKVLRSKASPVVVTLAPWDVITFRHLRHKQSFTITIADAFHYAVRAHALAQARAKKSKKGTK